MGRRPHDVFKYGYCGDDKYVDEIGQPITKEEYYKALDEWIKVDKKRDRIARNKQIAAAVSPEELDEINDFCSKNGVSKSVLIREAVLKAVKKE